MKEWRKFEMHFFMPELVYNEVSHKSDFIYKLKELNDYFDSKTYCIVDYTKCVNDESIYNDINHYLQNNLSDKSKKIWECFCADVTYSSDQDGWSKSDDVIQKYKTDMDVDVMMYAYYMELANTQDHKSKRWIKNIEESIDIWEEHKHRTFDTRLYTKYYWDKHEQFCFHLRNRDLGLRESYYEYESIDKEIKSFFSTKINSNDRYFWDIINHKTLYTVYLFWDSINHRTLTEKKESEQILKWLDAKIVRIPYYKYNNFNMHLLEWLWINFKWFVDCNDKEKSLIVWNKMIDVIEESLFDKKTMIKSLNHHNFSYTNNFLLFAKMLRFIESDIFIDLTPRINNLNWSQTEKDVINNLIPQDFSGERLITLSNNFSHKVEPVKNLFLN